MIVSDGRLIVTGFRGAINGDCFRGTINSHRFQRGD